MALFGDDDKFDSSKVLTLLVHALEDLEDNAQKGGDKEMFGPSLPSQLQSQRNEMIISTVHLSY
jgi:hypothetical protein